MTHTDQTLTIDRDAEETLVGAEVPTNTKPSKASPKRRRTALVVLLAAIALVAALLAGSLASGDDSDASGEVATDEAFDSFTTSDRGAVSTSSTVIERDDEANDDNGATDAGQPSNGGLPSDGGSEPGVEAGNLELSTSALSFGQHTTTKQLTVKNTGGETLAWSASESKPWMSVNPVQGLVHAGQSMVVSVTVNRNGMNDGTSFNGDLTFETSSGDEIVHVTGSTPFGMAQPVLPTVDSVNHAPVMCSANSPSGNKFTPIVASVDGPDIEYVKVYWAQNGSFGAFDMIHQGGDSWILPSFGPKPQGVVKLAIVAKNQYGTDTYESQISLVFCP